MKDLADLMESGRAFHTLVVCKTVKIAVLNCRIAFLRDETFVVLTSFDRRNVDGSFGCHTEHYSAVYVEYTLSKDLFVRAAMI